MKALKKLFIIYLAFLPLFTGFLSLGGDFGKLLNPTHTVEAQTHALNISYFNMDLDIPLWQARGGSIVKGPDGNLWFTVDTSGPLQSDNSGPRDTSYVTTPVKGSIGRITMNGNITLFPIPTSGKYAPGNNTNSNPFSITLGPDGNLWFTNSSANMIGKITTTGEITEYQLPHTATYMLPRSIITGPDGNIWVVGSGVVDSKIMSINTSGEIIKEFKIPGDSVGDSLAVGPDGNFWINGRLSYNLGRITPEGAFTEFVTGGFTVEEIVPGNNNDLWLGQSGGYLTRITTDGVITAFPTPGELAWNLAKDSDNNILFKDWLAEKINKIGPNGEEITSQPLSLVDGKEVWSYSMIFGPDGNLWFTQYGSIGRIELTTPTPTNTPAVTPTPEVTPSVTPTAEPSSTPELTPTPTVEPTVEPNATPTVMPTTEPTATPAPTDTPTVETNDEENNHITPTATPSPTVAPTTTPTPTNTPANDDDDSDTDAEVLGASTLPNTSAGNRGMAVVVTGIFGLFVGFFLIAFHFAVRLRNVYVKKPSNYVIYKKA